jgi:hypothetical protein
MLALNTEMLRITVNLFSGSALCFLMKRSTVVSKLYEAVQKRYSLGEMEHGIR